MKLNRILLPGIILIITFHLNISSAANAETSDLVKGFANYQAGRVENIILDGFVYDLVNEKYLKQFFPETSASINEYPDISGKRLIPLMSYYVNKDLDSLKDLAKCVKDKVKVLEQEVDAKKDDAEKNIAQALETLDWLLTLKTNPSFTTKDFLMVSKCNNNIKTEVERQNEFESVKIFSTIYKDTEEQVNKIIESKESQVEYINKKLESLVRAEAEKSLLKFVSNDAPAKGIDFPGFMVAINNITELEKSASENNRLYAIYVHQLAMALNALGFQVDDREGFQKFKNSSLFLASLAEAADAGNGGGPEAVGGVIDDFVKEEVVYKNKRNSVALYTRRPGKPNLRCSYFFLCKNTWFVGSYYGVSAGQLDENADGTRHWVYRAYGPVGVEFKLFSGPLAGKDLTVTLMAAPIDIGVYITDELKDDEYKVNVDDITAPSYFISFSSKRSPMSFQIGYQKDIPVANDRKESMYFAAFSFDLPLFTLW